MLARSFVFMCLVTAPFSPLMAQWGSGERPAPRLIRSLGPHVVFDLLAFKSSTNEDSTRMDLYLAVDYNSLEFLYAVDKYVADYSVTLQVMDDRSSMAKSNLILDRYETYTVLESTAEHNARIQNHQNRADAQQISCLLIPGTAYTMRLSVQDYSSHSSFDTSFDFTVKNFAVTTPAMSDLMIFRDRKGMRVEPSIGPDVSSLTDEVRMSDQTASGLFAELYNMPANSTLGIVTEILPGRSDHPPGGKSGDTGSVLSHATTTLRIPQTSGSASTAPPSIPVTPLFAPVSFDGMWTGYYTLHTYILPTVEDTSLRDPSALAARAITSADRQVFVTI
ncbi:MAG TPA: hypothetical protein VFX22_12190, partial [Candidatus Kapabacteria bacterium]|nr:hypothetical protein [Candidatus Kapabacteria bacterium]